MKWKPWDDFSTIPEDLSQINIPEPPCKECIYWKPHRKITTTKKGASFDGVQCCVNDEMYHDFSCYRPKEECEQSKTNPE